MPKARTAPGSAGSTSTTAAATSAARASTCRGEPWGLGPRYLEIEEFSHLNFGAGNAQIDLENDVVDWACG